MYAEKVSNDRIVIGLIPAFGPRTDFIQLSVSLSESLGSIRRAVSYVWGVGVHAEVVLVFRGETLSSRRDRFTLRQLNIGEGGLITFGVNTPSLPSYASTSCDANDVEIADDAMQKCLDHARKHSMVEVAGVLVGHEIGGKVFVTDASPVSQGDSVSVVLNSVEIARIAEKLRGQENYLVGWYHSHLKSQPLSSIDLRLQRAYQQLYPKALAMVLDISSGTVRSYRARDAPRPRTAKVIYLNMPEAKKLSVESDVIILTTILEEKEVAEIVNVVASDAQTGYSATFEVTVRNIGTLPLSKLQVQVLVTSPDNKETLSFNSEAFDLPLGGSKRISVKGSVPLLWPSGNAIVRASLIKTETRTRLCSAPLSTIVLTQPPIYDIKLRVLQTSQKIGLAQTATYLILVKESGNRRDDVEISLEKAEAPDSWVIQIYDGQVPKEIPFRIMLNPGESRRLILTTTAPSSGRGGTRVPITVKARSLGQTSSNQT